MSTSDKHVGLGPDCPWDCEFHGADWMLETGKHVPPVDRDEWKYGPLTDPREQVATGERADQIEARMRMEVEPWNVRDRRVGFPFGLLLLLILLGCAAVGAIWYVWVRLP